MRRFFFDFRQAGDLHHDDTGVDYPSAEAAYLGAAEAARDMWGELLSKRQDPRLCSFEIRGEGGALLFVLPFRELLDSCKDGRATSVAIRDTFRQILVTRANASRTREQLNREFQSVRRALRESAALLSKTV